MPKSMTTQCGDSPPKRKKLTFDLDPNLHRRFKQWCAGHDVTMVDWLSQKIDEQVNEV